MLSNAYTGNGLSRSQGPAVPASVPLQDQSEIVNKSPFESSLAITAEFNSLRNPVHCPSGIYVVPSLESVFSWTAVFFVTSGYYASAVLRFRLEFPSNYPALPPDVFFTTDMFHPLVSQLDGSLSLSPGLKPWRPEEHHVLDVLYWIREVFEDSTLDTLEEDHCRNRDAYRHRDSKKSFAALALQTSNLSQSPSALFDGDHPQVGGRNKERVFFKQMSSQELARTRASIGLPTENPSDPFKRHTFSNHSHPVSIKRILQECELNCAQGRQAIIEYSKLHSRGAKKPTGAESTTTSHTVVRSDFLALLALLDSHTTRLGLSLKPPTTQDGVIQSAFGISDAVGQLASCSLTVPPSVGRTMQKEIWWGALDVLEAVGGLSKSLSDSIEGNAVANNYLRLIGSVHATLDRVRDTLSENNLSAVQARWKSNSASMKDALKELKDLLDKSTEDEEHGSVNAAGKAAVHQDPDDWDAIFDDEAGEERLSPSEFKIATELYAVLHLTNALHNKMIDNLGPPDYSTPERLDRVLESSELVAATFDELVVALSPKQDVDMIKVHGTILMERVEDFRSFLQLRARGNAITKLTPHEQSDITLKNEEVWFDKCFEQIFKANSKVNA